LLAVISQAFFRYSVHLIALSATLTACFTVICLTERAP